MEARDGGGYNESVPFAIKVHSWNRQTTLPRTLSVICPKTLLGDDGKRLHIESHSMKLGVKPSDTQVFSASLNRPCKALSSIRSFFFFPQDDIGPGRAEKVGFARNEDGSSKNKDLDETTSGSSAFLDLSDSPTRIRVPSDVVKIEDRLGYILQPPIETWFGRRLLETPFEPFGYQKQGVAFLYGAHHAILADEMGLGKTMQAITTIRLLFRSGECRRVLLVCPKPLVTNWKREFEIWAPEIPVQIIEGKSERRKWLWRRQNTPLRIANYELLSRDREFFDSLGGAPVTFDLVVLDESQRIKNKLNVTSEAARAIPRRRSWALTGTPVENSAEDLVGIFEFLAPGYLESGLKPSQLSKLVGEHILRRTKDQVLKDLPPKLIRDAHIELTDEQYKTYRLAQEEGEIRLNAMGDSVTLHHAFELILRLKQICNYDLATGESAKLERLIADMEEVAESGRKAIVFSQWVQTIQWLKPRLEQFGPLEYHGKTPNKERDAVIERFRNDPDKHIILMSYGAGSVGLNLQFAEYVFLFDRWWNPAVEDQAINRAHRIGAAGPVTVTRFVTDNTIEEKIDQILTEKRMLSEAILSDAKGLNYSMGLSQKDIFGLFNIKVSHSMKK
ncbi:MAG: DEAD/DEAH box helicase [Thermoguttaceae bacterium]|jgi:SNF2 family DNA or RNA helicase|nr:DEAD/DEAH box helicase [Thermoguttaceae bacterium]